MKPTLYIPKANILNYIWLMKYFDTPLVSVGTVIGAECVKPGILTYTRL